MRELAFGGRRTGRTTTLILTMLEEMEMHDKTVYLVVSKFCNGHMMKDYIRKFNGDPARVRIVPIHSLFTIRGVDPMNVYIEHTAYEDANANELSDLFRLEDMKDCYIWRDRVA